MNPVPGQSESDARHPAASLSCVSTEDEAAQIEAMLAALQNPPVRGKVVEESLLQKAIRTGDFSLYRTPANRASTGTQTSVPTKPTKSPSAPILKHDIDPTGNGFARKTKRARREGVRAPWKAQGPVGRIIQAHDGLLALGQRVMSFSVNIPKDRWTKAIASGNVDRFFALRIRHQLAKAGLPSSFWFVFEISPSGIPHIHGAGIVPEGQEAVFRERLRLAVGPWRTARQFQADTNERCDFGWVRYATEGFGKHGIPGRGYYSSRDVLQKGIELYEAERQFSLIKPAVEAPHAPENKSVNTDLHSSLFDKMPDFHDKCRVTHTETRGQDYASPDIDAERGDVALCRASPPSPDRDAIRLCPGRLPSPARAIRDGARRRAHRSDHLPRAGALHAPARPP